MSKVIQTFYTCWERRDDSAGDMQVYMGTKNKFPLYCTRKV